MALLKWEFLLLACHGVKVTSMLASLVVWFVYTWINDLRVLSDHYSVLQPA